MPKAKSKTKATIPATRPGLFRRPPLLMGEDAAAYDGLFAGIHAAVKPLDTLEKMLVADVGGVGVGGPAASVCGLAGVSRCKNRPKRIFGPFSRLRVDY
jgi:hypothetical protein